MSPEMFDLSGAVAIVSGASGWLGPSMVKGMLDCGATVVGVARCRESLEARLAGLDVVIETADVQNDTWPSMVSAVGERYGRVDVLINNAHQGHGGSLDTATAELFAAAWDLSVVAAWKGIQAARPWLAEARDAGGAPSVINVASMYGLVGPDLSLYDTPAGRTPPFYGSAKAGLLQLTRYAAAELGPEGIRVNSISLGPFPAEAAQADPDFIKRLASRTMLGRIGQPQELATAVAFLAARSSGFVTAASIVVDGGWTAR